MVRANNPDQRHPERRLEDAQLLHARHRLVGERLRREYAGIAAEPLPPQFVELLKKVSQHQKPKL